MQSRLHAFDRQRWAPALFWVSGVVDGALMVWTLGGP